MNLCIYTIYFVFLLHFISCNFKKRAFTQCVKQNNEVHLSDQLQTFANKMVEYSPV